MLRSWHIGAWVWVVVSVGCEVFDPALLEGSEASGIRTGGDGGSRRPDAGSAPGCSGTRESCNGEDDDCDGKVDEGADDACTLRNAVAACASDGTCVIA